ncbi:hypothetical protein FGO68_gene13852 [Halteria grandinella]|uniref:Uncharacterized protein n=1 Tax=Halteria grandinella TaxID=5974 RepID=A0A8J8P6C7_HALGN|nr:hypothetical protein FGO68_gene13852 [Halteria grandinella]
MIQIPQVFEVDIQTKLTLPIFTLKNIPQVNIILRDCPLNMRFSGSEKIGNNIHLTVNYKDSSYPICNFVNTFFKFINFELCNFRIFNSWSSIKEAESLFQKLQTLFLNPKGKIQFDIPIVQNTLIFMDKLSLDDINTLP